MVRVLSLVILLEFLCPFQFTYGKQFFAAHDGKSVNNGSYQSPWDLKTAFNKTNTILPGDTLWLRGGTYFGSALVDQTTISAFVCSLSGTAIKPILIRNYNGEKVVIDGGNRPHPVIDSVNNNDSYTLAFIGNYNIVWGLEITNSNVHSRSDSLAGFRWRVRSLITLGMGHKFINLIIHDCGNGHGFFSGCTDCEMYGNIIYYNGWSHLGLRGHGEGVYAQNTGTTKYLKDNIVFRQFDSGIILYGSKESEIENFYLEGNILFDNGKINDNPNGWGLLVGRNTTEKGPCQNFVFKQNICYNALDYKRSNNFDLAYQSGLERVDFIENYSVGYNAIKYNIPVLQLKAYDNTFVGGVENEAIQISRDSNLFYSPNNLPKENVVFIRPNEYESGRAHICIFNWEHRSTESIDLSKLNLVVGKEYEVYDIQHLSGKPIEKFIVQQQSAQFMLPLNLTAVDTVIGTGVPRQAVHTPDLFNVFLIRPSSNSPSGTTTKNGNANHERSYYDRSMHELDIHTNNNDNIMDVSLMDMRGQQWQLKDKIENSRIKIPSQLSDGLYVLTVVTQTSAWVEKNLVDQINREFF